MIDAGLRVRPAFYRRISTHKVERLRAGYCRVLAGTLGVAALALVLAVITSIGSDTRHSPSSFTTTCISLPMMAVDAPGIEQRADAAIVELGHYVCR